MKTKKFLVQNLWLFLSLACYVVIADSLGLTCALKFLFHIPCPTCGVTRALCSFAKGNWNGYVKYNVMAIPLLSAVWLLLNIEFFNRKRIICFFAYTVLVINIFYYVGRITLYV